MVDFHHVNNVESLGRYEVSICALQNSTNNLISALLNPPLVLQSDDGFPRDWHGLAEVFGIEGELIRHLECSLDPSRKLLTLWHQRDPQGSTIKKLLECMEKIDRFDVVDDLQQLLDKDIKLYERKYQNEPRNTELISEENFIITIDDFERYERGLGPQSYDAFILFADEDVEFVKNLIEKLENEFNFKLCLKDRDLIPGVMEHEGVMKLIAERCHRVIAVMSPAFLKNPYNRFVCNYAQTLGIENDMRKIIPLMYIPCQLPPQLRCYYSFDYERQTKVGNFWRVLRISIAPNTIIDNNDRSNNSEVVTPNRDIQYVVRPMKEETSKKNRNGVNKIISRGIFSNHTRAVLNWMRRKTIIN